MIISRHVSSFNIPSAASLRAMLAFIRPAEASAASIPAAPVQ